MKNKFTILIGIFSVIISIVYLWWNQGIKPADPTITTPVNVTVDRNESVRTIAQKLQNAGVIRSPVAFFLLTRFGGYGDKIQAGEFRLTPSMDLFTVADTLTHGTMDVWVTMREGLRKEEIASILSKNLSFPENEFLKRAKEGYLFPDTYRFPKDATIDMVLETFAKNFDKKVTIEISDIAQKKGLSLDEVVTIASLVEREAKNKEDRPIVAGIILNRLKIDMKLDIDATVQYALGYQSKEKTWWKKDLTQEDLSIDSPYNTYVNPGLPPGPIANPGLAAIQAVVDTRETENLYYISDKSGKIHPAKTIEEHNTNIAKYLNK